jgi:hypothetical protein
MLFGELKSGGKVVIDLKNNEIVLEGFANENNEIA